MLGLGTQDDREAAEAFVADTGVTSLPMLWDASARSWRELGITGQPAAVLLDAEGRELARWSGIFPEGEVLALAAEAGDAPR